MKSLWEGLKEKLRSKLTDSSYRVWIAPLTYEGVDGDTLTVSCPNQFVASWVQEHYLPAIREDLVHNGQPLKIQLNPAQIVKEAARGQMHLPNFAPNELCRPRFCERFTFPEFVVGESNRFAYTACWAMANEEPNHNKVLYLHAQAGLGKSHLAQAVGQTLLEKRPQARLCYLTANDFTNQMVKALQDGQMGAFTRRYRESCDVLLLEDVHSFSGRERTQTELALALDTLLDENKLVIFTGDRLPREIAKVNDHLRSRLGSGLITSINPPDLATRRKIVARKARRQGVEISEEIIDFLAQNLTGDIRRIEGAVVCLIAKSSLLKQSIDVALAKEVIQDLVGEPQPLTAHGIKQFICEHYQVTEDEICSRSRKREVTWPRQVAMFLVRRYTEESLESIGKLFHRDHATVLHSVKQANKKINESSQLRSQIEFLMNELEKERWHS